jgi:hypothetical protein
MRTPSIAGIFGYFFGASGEIVSDIKASICIYDESRFRLPDAGRPCKEVRRFPSHEINGGPD